MSDLCWLCVLSSIIVAIIMPAYLFSCLFATWLNLHDILGFNIDIDICFLNKTVDKIYNHGHPMQRLPSEKQLIQRNSAEIILLSDQSWFLTFLCYLLVEESSIGNYSWLKSVERELIFKASLPCEVPAELL